MATQQSALSRALDNRTVLGRCSWCPALRCCCRYFTYPLGLGTWLGFTDAKIGRPGEWMASRTEYPGATR
jgi:multiple sugar transport system permease protein